MCTGDVEAHATLKLNFRDRKLVSCGTVRPESRTKTKLGKSVTAGTWHVIICACLSVFVCILTKTKLGKSVTAGTWHVIICVCLSVFACILTKIKLGKSVTTGT
jgi:hypothetical protein